MKTPFRARLEALLHFMDTPRGITAALGLAYLAGVALTLLLVTASAYGPVHFDDEIRYWLTASRLHTGQFNVTELHHSPPLYSIALLPALSLPAADIYAAIKVLNVLFITSVVFPAYLLMRQFAGRRYSLLIAALILLLPAQVVIPRLVMSENLFYPLFLWGVYLAFVANTAPHSRLRWLENVLFGTICGLMVLTRYLALPIVPMLFLIWWLRPFQGEHPRLLISKHKVLHAASIFIPFALVLGVWVVLGLQENVPFKEMIGFGVANNPDPAQLGRRRLVMWASFYLSYVALMLAPHLGVFAAAISQLRPGNWREPLNRWVIAISLISASFLVTATRHSWRARYNYPEPETIQGRYIFYLAPLFLIALFAILKKAKLPRLSRSGYWLVAILLGELVILAYAIIYYGLVFLGRPMRMSLNSPDGYLFESLGLGYLALVLVVLAFSTRWMANRRQMLLAVLPVALAGMYLAGNAQLYQKILKPLQDPNYPAIQLMHLMETRYGAQRDVRSEPVTLFVPYEVNTEYCGIWRATFRFHGFQDVKCEFGHGEARTKPEVFSARFGADELTVKTIQKQNYNPARPNQFAFNGKYYLISAGGE